MSFEWAPGDKVFSVGFHKTGTKSLAKALRQLGFRVHGPEWAQDRHVCASYEGLLEKAVGVVPHFDAFQDNPWPLLWRDLVEVYPDAYYILTTREPQVWIESVCSHFGGNTTPMRELIYGQGKGDPLGNEDLYLRRFVSHNSEVRAALSGRFRFLELDVASQDVWTPLCGFLGLPVPLTDFPHENSKIQRVKQAGAK